MMARDVKNVEYGDRKKEKLDISNSIWALMLDIGRSHPMYVSGVPKDDYMRPKEETADPERPFDTLSEPYSQVESPVKVDPDLPICAFVLGHRTWKEVLNIYGVCKA